MTELSCIYLPVGYIWLCDLIISSTCFKVNTHSIVTWMSLNSLLKAGAKSKVQMTVTGIEPTTTQLVNENLTILQNWPND